MARSEKFKELQTLLHHLTLGELIEILKVEQEMTPNRIVKEGFGSFHSWRGDYFDLAFEPKRNVSIDDMLSEAKSVVGATLCGYKGGEYKMTEYTDVWLDYYGESDGVPFSRFVLKQLEIIR